MLKNEKKNVKNYVPSEKFDLVICVCTAINKIYIITIYNIAQLIRFYFSDLSLKIFIKISNTM